MVAILSYCLLFVYSCQGKAPYGSTDAEDYETS